MNEHIPEGHIVTITTWENDADNYKTEDWTGLSLEEAKFYKWITSFFTNEPRRFGNGIVSNDVYSTMAKEFDPSEFPNVQNLIDEYLHQSSYNIIFNFFEDYVIDIVGTWNDGYRHRVVECISILFNDQPIDFTIVDTI